jgi:hypothetical protein
MSLTGNKGVGQPTSVEPKWVQIGLAVLVAGVVPTVAALIVRALFIVTGAGNLPPEQLSGVNSFIAKFDFIAHCFIPLSCGFWAAFAWPGKHARGNILLGLCAAVLVIIVALFFALTLPASFTLEPKDFLFAFTTATLFGGGALFADYIQERRSLRAASDGTGQSGPVPELVRLIAPSILTAVGTITAAVISS